MELNLKEKSLILKDRVKKMNNFLQFKPDDDKNWIMQEYVDNVEEALNDIKKYWKNESKRTNTV